MKQFLIAMAAAFMGIMPLAGYGQTELTVYSGSATNSYVPIISAQCDKWQKSEYIIPASDLVDMNGKLIAKLKLYQNYSEYYYGYINWGAQFKVFLKEVDFTIFPENPSYQGFDDATVVYEGSLWPRDQVLNVEFDNFYSYNGGNLLVGFYTMATGNSCNYVGFYGQDVTGASIEGYDASNLDNVQANQRNFIPKTSFTYYDEDYCFAPKDLVFDETSITSTSVELVWTPRGNEQEWRIKCSVWDPNEEEYIESIVDGITEHPYTLSGLDPATYYSVSVAADCGDDNTSDWSSSIEFMTGCAEFASVPLYEGFENDYPVCWSIYGSGYYNNYVYTTYEGYESDNSLMFNLQDANSACYAILPAIADLDECQISFYAMAPDNWYPTGAFSVGVMTDPTNPSTFVTIKTFESTYEWMEYKAYFDQYTGNGTHIAIKMDASYHGMLLVDEVSVEAIEANTCFEIDALVPTYVGMNSAVVSWMAHGNESNWQIQYREEEEEWPELSTMVATSSYTIENMEPNTKYYVRVRAYCSAESQSDWMQISFTTPFCDPENQCDIHYVLRTSEYGWDGNSIDVYDEDEVLVGSLTVENGSVQEGDLYLCDGATYNFVLRIDNSWALEYSSFVIYGPDGNPIEGLNYSAGTMPTGDYGDEITLLSGFEMVCPDCRRPRNLSADDITSSSAVMTWQAGGTETAWVLQYSTDQSTWQDVQVNTNPTYTLQNLDGNKVYYVRVLAHCGGNDYSIPSNVYSFRTDCPEYQTIPYSEDFDSYEPFDPYAGGGGEWKGSRTVASDHMPFCWSSLNESGYYDNRYSPYIFNDGGNETESNVLKFYVYYNGVEETADQYAILPAMQNINGLQLRFNAMAGESSDLAPFSVGVMSNPADSESFVEIQSYEATGTWNSFVAYFDQYEGEGEYIAIKVGTPGQWQSYILYVDDVEVSELPTCFVPFGLDFNPSSITENSVMIGWEPYGNETAWEIQYTTDQINWTSIPVTNQNATINDGFVIYTIEDLLANTMYYVQVRANCGNEDFSEWSAVKSFRTACDEYQMVPYYEDFESYDFGDLPQCWEKINESTYEYNDYPYVSSDENGNFFVFYMDRNDRFDFQTQTAILPKMENISNLQLRFDAKDDSQGGYAGHIIVGVIDDNEEFHQIVVLDPENNYFSSHIVTFEDYNGAGDVGRIAFRLEYFYANTWYYHVFIDNILVANYVNTDIEAYTADDNGWYLIASPVVGSISPLKVDNMTNENFDLYAFDQSADDAEWRNYKANAFMLENGQGYLYANDNDITLSFAGAMQPAASVEIPLDYVAGKSFAGWNLVGNPFDCNATLIGNLDYYRINGNRLEVSSGVIAPCEGIFVQATAAGQSVTFERAEVVVGEPETEGFLNLGLYKGGVLRRIDLARIRFGEGVNLGKLNLLSDPNKLYIPLDGIDYATVHTGTVGELPINFDVAESGCFTLTADLEDVELDYLHLIDNLTGKDINLLETPSYTFQAKTSDYAARFKVVFAIGSSSDDEDFAFMRNGHLLILGQEDQAMLQVIDMTGRVLSSETFNGNYDKAFGFSNGLYVLRLISGENVRTQKIVVTK